MSTTLVAQDGLLEREIEVDIGGQPLASALLEFSRQANVQVVAPTELVAPMITAGIRGRMPMRQALAELLRGTTLVFRAAGKNAIGIGPVDATLAPTEVESASSQMSPQGVLPSATDESSLPDRTTVTDDADPVGTIPVAVQEPPSGTTQGEDGATYLDTIQVTSSKRVKAQRDLPASISAFRGDDLEKINAVSIKDYLKTVPGVHMQESEQDRSIVTIRGISVATSFQNTQPTTVGVFLDDLPLNDTFTSLTMPDLNPFDMERVEVLKGPQGTLFGAGALAGAIRYVSKKPEMGVWNAKLQSTYSDSQFGEPRQFLGGALNIPVYRDEAAIRVAALWFDRGGLIDTVTEAEPPDLDEIPGGTPDDGVELGGRGRDVDSLRQLTGRLTGQWDVNERLRLNLLGFNQVSDQADTVATDNFDGEYQARGHPFAAPTHTEFSAINLVPSYEFDWGTLTSSTGYVTKDILLVSDINSVPVGEETATGADDEPGDDLGTEDQPFLSRPGPNGGYQSARIQELRLTSPEGADSNWEWLAGLSYFSGRQYYSAYLATAQPLTDVRDDLPDPCAPPACPVETPAGELNGREYELQVFSYDNDIAREIAAFGEATYRFFDDRRLEVTLGGRLFQNRLGVTLEGRGLLNFTTVGRPSYRERRDFKENGFNPKVSARYIFTPHIQTYVLAAKGFQFGGVQVNTPLNDQLSSSPQATLPYKSSKLWNYEWGWRTEFFERRLRLDWTAYYYDWRDLQLSVLDHLPGLPEDPPLPGRGATLQERRGLFFFIDNVARAKSQGVEAALAVSPLRGLTYTSSANWMKAVLTRDYEGGNFVVPAGTKLAGAPNFQISNALSYTTPLDWLGGLEGGASLSHLHVSDANSDLFQPLGTDKFDQVDAGISLSKPDWRLAPTLSFTVNNLTDTRAVSSVVGNEQSRNLSVIYIQPRTMILGLDLKW